MKIEELMVGDWINLDGPIKVDTDLLHYCKLRIEGHAKPLIMSSVWAESLLGLKVKTGLDSRYTELAPYLDLVYESLEYPSNTLVVTIGDNYAPIGRIRYVHDLQHFLKSVLLDKGEGKSIFSVI